MEAIRIIKTSDQMMDLFCFIFGNIGKSNSKVLNSEDERLSRERLSQTRSPASAHTAMPVSPVSHSSILLYNGTVARNILDF